MLLHQKPTTSNRMSTAFQIALLCCLPIFLSAQTLTGLSTRWSDSFAEWRIHTMDERQEGELRQIWLNQDNWTEWRYRLGEASGTIKLKWQGNPNQWEARGDNQIVTARTLFNNNFREWRVSDGTHSVTLECRYGNIWDEWRLRSERYGWFEMYTYYQGDPRDWVIVDELREEVPLPMKMMLSFLVAFHSSPKQ